MKNFNSMIEEICEKKNINLNIVSDGWVKILEKDGKYRYISQLHFDINPCASSRIMDEKYALYETLKFFKIPVAEHNIIYKTTPSEVIENLFNKYNKHVVIKANTGSRGMQVFHATTLEQLKEEMDHLFIKNYSLSLSPYYDIKTEYRLILLDGNIELIYGKIRPIVTGDGKTSIKDLLIKFNSKYFSDKNLPEDILVKGEKYEYNWQFNLSKGASSTLKVPEDKKEKMLKIAKMVSDKLNIKFCSIDIIETDNDFMILEINSGIAIDKFTYQHENGREIAMNVYGKAIDLLFKD